VGVIIYGYLGYPVLSFLLARAFSHPVRFTPGSEAPSVTLLIAAYNEEAVIREKLRNSLEIEYPDERLEILVVTDGSSDATPALVEEFAAQGVRLLHQPERRGKMAAINRALPSARGEIIVFSDANNLYRTDTVRNLVEPFSDPAIGGVSGSKRIEPGSGSLGASEGLYWKYESFIKKQESRLGSCTSATGEILAIRRDLYQKPPDNIINDDFYLAMQVIRQGYRLVYVPQAVSYERVSQTARDEIIRRTRINAGRYQSIALSGRVLPFGNPVLVWQVLSHKFLRPLIPFFMITAALFNLAAVLNPPDSGGFWALARPWGAYLVALQVLFYGLALLGSRSSIGGRKGRLSRLLYLPTFLLNSNLAALRGLAMYLRGGQFHIWERIRRD
jgi:cellulose synthase/poly-beta-1,6-N-acetylglucosamine synthase-like glycosyltransferase